jgi:hypothetical protein
MRPKVERDSGITNKTLNPEACPEYCRANSPDLR